MGKYDKIIDLPYNGRMEGELINGSPKMTMYQRAAQFAPFAALTGHDEAINETAHRVEEEMSKINVMEDDY